jgi:hypothetical protein
VVWWENLQGIVEHVVLRLNRQTLGRAIMSKENQWQYCKKCGRDQRFEFSIREEIWSKLPEKWINHVLCIECFLEELEKASPDQRFELSDFAFIGIVGERFKGGILIDNPKVKA